eukprot:6263012-Heterocapsa_arctica.AAC.1
MVDEWRRTAQTTLQGHWSARLVTEPALTSHVDLPLHAPHTPRSIEPDAEKVRARSRPATTR